MSGEAIIAACAVVFGLLATSTVLVEFSRRWFAYREKKLEVMAAGHERLAAASASHVERLEQRMRVLEHIATDKGVDIAAQIETLRDAPALAQIAHEEFGR